MPSSGTARQRAPRGTGQRTRTGCLTCKQRRVKCDEEKPFCRRCLDGGHECTGYPAVEPIQRRSSRSPSRVSPSSTGTAGDGPPPVASTVTTVGPALSPRVAWSAAERRSIEFVVRNLIPGLLGDFESKFWRQHVLQLGHSEAAVKHALAALGAVHETRSLARARLQASASASARAGTGAGAGAGPSTTVLTGPAGAQEASARRLALQQYNYSIQHLGQTVKDAGPGSTQAALVCCLVFITLELLQNNNDQALKHLRAGIRIYRSRMPRESRARASDLLAMSEDGVGELFFHLDSQATGYLDTRRPQLVPDDSHPATSSRGSSSASQATRSASPPSGSPPVALPALRARLEDLHKQCLVFLVENQTYRHVPRHRVPDDIIAEHAALLANLQAFGAALRAVTAAAAADRPDASPEMSRGLQRLVLAHRAIAVMLRAAHVELPGAALDSEYAAVLDAAEPLLPEDTAAAGALVAAPLPFTLDATMVPALFMAAHAAPRARTRARATALLRRARVHEGLWNSEVAAQIAERCTVEEVQDDEEEELLRCVPESMPQLVSRLGVDESAGFEPVTGSDEMDTGEQS